MIVHKAMDAANAISKSPDNLVSIVDAVSPGQLGARNINGAKATIIVQEAVCAIIATKVSTDNFASIVDAVRLRKQCAWIIQGRKLALVVKKAMLSDGVFKAAD